MTDLQDELELFYFLVFQSLVIVELVPGIHNLVTQVTVITENVWIMLRLHVIPCAGTVLMRKLVTKSAVEPSILCLAAHELEQLTGLLELASWGGSCKLINSNLCDL